jgi:import inner membrane translocase subunit TIM22
MWLIEFSNTHCDIMSSHSLVVLFVILWLTGSMEDSNLRGLVGEEIFMEAGKTAGIGLAAGSVWGALVSVLYDGPQVGSNGKYPQLIRTGKVCGHYAANFAIIGGTYVGVEQALEKYRMKKDIFNGVAASFATGAAMGLRGMALILLQLFSLFVRLISHQPAVLFSQNKPAKNTFINVRNMC